MDNNIKHYMDYKKRLPLTLKAEVSKVLAPVKAKNSIAQRAYLVNNALTLAEQLTTGLNSPGRLQKLIKMEAYIAGMKDFGMDPTILAAFENTVIWRHIDAEEPEVAEDKAPTRKKKGKVKRKDPFVIENK